VVTGGHRYHLLRILS